jgi:hypothetical protein
MYTTLHCLYHKHTPHWCSQCFNPNLSSGVQAIVPDDDFHVLDKWNFSRLTSFQAMVRVLMGAANIRGLVGWVTLSTILVDL